MRLIQFSKRVAVVGMYRAGKTVFMTSLINHLSRHDPGRFPLGRGDVALTNFRRLPAQEGWEEFEYDRHRLALQEAHRWPSKTLVNRQYRCSFTRSDWPHTLIDLTLMDLPGERLADMTMAGQDYAAWSEATHALLASSPEYRALAGEYLALADPVREAAPEEAAYLQAYRLALARACLAYLPVITPSSLLLGPGGDYVPDRTAEDIAAHRYVGLDAASQFAPLPQALRRRHPELAQAFARRYQAYRRAVVMPLAHWLAGCHELVILMDLTSLLAAGLGAYHGALHMLEELLDWVDPGRGPLGQLFSLVLRPLSGGRITLPGVTRIALVAAKADKVHAADRQRLLGLLKDMAASRLAGRQEDVKLRVEYFVCASVKSTASRPDLTLEGQPVREGGETGLAKFAPSRLPDHWPADWPPGRFNFPDVLPQMPARRDLAPAHIGLNAVADFILADDDWTE